MFFCGVLSHLGFASSVGALLTGCTSRGTRLNERVAACGRSLGSRSVTLRRHSGLWTCNAGGASGGSNCHRRGIGAPRTRPCPLCAIASCLSRWATFFRGRFCEAGRPNTGEFCYGSGSCSAGGYGAAPASWSPHRASARLAVSRS